MKILLFILLSISIQAETIQDFSLPIYKSKETFNLKKTLKKKKVVINFWASWCTSCIKEIPILEKLKKENPQVEFVAINAGDTKKKIKKFLKKYKFSYKVLEDKSKELSKSLGVLNLPQTWVIGKNGNVLYKSDIPPEKL